MPSSQHDIYISEAIAEASKSAMGYRHGCIIRKRNKIVGRGHNKLICNSRPLHYVQKSVRSTHAEMEAISVTKKNDLKNAILYVARINKSHHACNSKPCKSCARLINTKFKEYNLTVFYTVDNSG